MKDQTCSTCGRAPSWSLSRFEASPSGVLRCLPCVRSTARTADAARRTGVEVVAS